MSGSFRNSSSRPTGSILAASFVLLVGALGLSIVIVATGGDPVFSLISVVLASVCFVLLIWLIRASTNSSAMRGAYNWVFSKNVRPEPEYEPRRATTASERYGTRRPSTPEELKELREDGMRNWVPAKGKSGREHLRRPSRDERP